MLEQVKDQILKEMLLWKYLFTDFALELIRVSLDTGSTIRSTLRRLHDVVGHLRITF